MGERERESFQAWVLILDKVLIFPILGIYRADMDTWGRRKLQTEHPSFCLLPVKGALQTSSPYVLVLFEVS